MHTNDTENASELIREGLVQRGELARAAHGGPPPIEPLSGDLETTEGVCYRLEADGSLALTSWRHGGAAGRPKRERIEGAEAIAVLDRYLGRARSAELVRERTGKAPASDTTREGWTESASELIQRGFAERAAAGRGA